MPAQEPHPEGLSIEPQKLATIVIWVQLFQWHVGLPRFQPNQVIRCQRANGVTALTTDTASTRLEFTR